MTTGLTLTGGREIARRIADGESDDIQADRLVLIDWMQEQEARREPVSYDRVAWWECALHQDPEAASLALALGCETATSTALRAMIRRELVTGSRRCRELAARFTRMAGASWHPEVRVGLPSEVERLLEAQKGVCIAEILRRQDRAAELKKKLMSKVARVVTATIEPNIIGEMP